MTTLSNLRYSKQLSERVSHVFIDGVCVKSRTRSDNNISIEEAMAENQSVLIQEGTKIKIHVDNENLDYYKDWVEKLTQNTDEKANAKYTHILSQPIPKSAEKNTYDHMLAQAFTDGSILVITEDYKNGYQFT